MQKILVLIGLPASGKSTFCKEFIHFNPEYRRVNKDSIREMLNFSDWSPLNEKLVQHVRDCIIHEIIRMGFSVIIDDTNLQVIHHKTFNEIAELYGIEIEYKYFDVSVRDCIERDSRREGKARVGESVIHRLWNDRTIDVEEFK